MVEFILGIFKDPKKVESINQIPISLIPKRGRAENVNDLRPMSLGNAVYKVVTKTIANRVKPILPQIISPAQAGELCLRKFLKIFWSIRKLLITLPNAKQNNSTDH